MFASYKSQSTGNQGEANDIITFYITHKWPSCPGKGKAIKRTPSGHCTMPAFRERTLAPISPCNFLGLSHPCSPSWLVKASFST